MTDVGGNYNVFNNRVPEGWSVASGTPDIFDENTNFQNFAWDASGDGGTFVHANFFNTGQEGLTQTITDLIVGQAYIISFEQSISFRSPAFAGTPGRWDVHFGDSTLSSAAMVTPLSSTPFGWQIQNLVFTATATIQDLTFLANQAAGDPSVRVDLGLDGVSIAVIPLPAAVWLFASALGFLGWSKHRTA